MPGSVSRSRSAQATQGAPVWSSFSDWTAPPHSMHLVSGFSITQMSSNVPRGVLEGPSASPPYGPDVERREGNLSRSGPLLVLF